MSLPRSQEHFPKKSVAVAVSAACAGVPAANAQDEGIQEIVVTATKREASINDVPMSIAAFTDTDIVRQGFQQLADYAVKIPALSFGMRHPGGSNVIMRGCSVSGIAFSDNPTTAVYLDEQPITVAGFNPDPRLVDIARVEALSGPQGTLFGDSSQCGTLRIITNKPDTTDFSGTVDLGANTIDDGETGYDASLVLNIPLVEDRAAIRLVGFSAKEAGYVDNVLGLAPVGEVYPQGRVGTFDNSEFVAEDVNSATITGGRAMLRWLPTDTWTVDVGAIYQRREEDGFGDTDLAENYLNAETLGEWEQLRYEREGFNDEWYQFALTLEGQIAGAEVVLATSYMDRESDYRTDATTYLAGWQERYTPKWSDQADPADCINGTTYCSMIYDYWPSQNPRAQVMNEDSNTRTSVEFRVATPSDSDSRWSGIIGAFYNKTENQSHFVSNVENLADSGVIGSVDYNGVTYYFGGAHFYLNYIAFYYNCGTGPDYANDCTYPVALSNNWWNGVYDNTLTQVAVFGEFNFDINENFQITLGGRWYDTEIDRVLQQATLVGAHQDYRTMAPLPNCLPANPNGFKGGDLCYQDTRSTAKESGFVPKATLTWDVNADLLAYATYSEGFRRGGANAAKPRSIFGRPPYNEFQSDLVKNYEAGIKSTLANGRMQFNLTAYHMVWEDMQIEAEDPTPNLFTLGILNFPEATIDGVEAFLFWKPADSWDVTMNLGINNAELSKSGTLEVDGAPIDRSAEKGTRLPLVPDWKGSIVVDKYFDGRLFGAQPSLGFSVAHTGESVNSLSGIQSVEFDQPVRTQAAYTLTNLRFGLDGEKWSAQLYVNNLFNEYAEEFYNDRWAQTRLSVNRPRRIGVSFRYSF